MTHTPGPWFVGEVHRAPTVFGFENDGVTPLEVARCNMGRDDDPYAASNAVLIRSAPDLLEALKEIATSTCDHNSGPCPRTIARAAIRKAEGGQA